MINFAEHQLRARRASRYLIWTMVAAVSSIVAVLYLVVAVMRMQFQAPAHVGFWQPDSLLFVLFGFTLVSGSATLVRYLQLRKGGGASVALSLGGRIISPATTDPDERILNNIVDEMAIASSMPRPLVFVLDREPLINAFAAGYSPADAVVAVSAGALKRLTRDELTGVVAHEFSHIANGDTAINLRLIATTAGILVLSQIGLMLVRAGLSGATRRGGRRRSSRGDAKGALALAAAGVAFWVLGVIGVFAARLIRAGLSRQREYLADASAVQYTRNPTGLGDALQRVLTEQQKERQPPSTFTEEVNHMLLIEALSSRFFGGLLASHPPLDRRIAALRGLPAPTGDGKHRPSGQSGAASNLVAPSGTPNALPLRSEQPPPGSSLATGPDRMAPHMARVPEVSEELRQLAREFLPATGLVLATLLARDGATRSAQVQMVRERTPAAVVTEMLRLYPAVQTLSPLNRLAVVELCFSTLRQLGDSQKSALLHAVSDLCLADGRIEAFEFVLYHFASDALVPPKPQQAAGDPYDAASRVLLYLGVCGHARNPMLGMGAVLAGLARLQIPPRHLGRLPRQDELDMGQISAALMSLKLAGPAFRLAFIETCRDVVLFDGKVTDDEQVLLRALELVLGVA